MLSKDQRLKKEKDFQKIFEKGKGFKEDSLYLKLKKSDSPRFGFVVSKKISSKAHDRNRIRRKLREAVKKELPKVRNIEGVIVVLPGFKEENITKKIKDLFLKADIIK